MTMQQMNCWKDLECYTSGMYQYVWSDWIDHHHVTLVAVFVLILVLALSFRTAYYFADQL